MVDALFSMIFAPMVQVKADSEKKYFKKVICDGGELTIELTHVLTHYDLQTIQKIRTMLNETLCDEDNIKQAHLAAVDDLIKKLFTLERLSLDIYRKLQALRDEDESNDRKILLKQQKKIRDIERGYEEDNFFLEDDETNNFAYEEVNQVQDQDDEKYENVQKELDKEDIERQKRYQIESEKGYFLQPVYAEKMSSKIFLYNDMVRNMKHEFKDRLKNKRDIIHKMRHLCKEYAVNDATLLCGFCESEVSLLKTVRYKSDDMHQATCIFGFLKRIEVKEAKEDPNKHY